MTYAAARQLATWAAAVDRPAPQVSSFTLHAPLEIVSRYLLMQHADPACARLYAAQQAATVARYRHHVPGSGSGPVDAGHGATTAQLGAALADLDIDASARITRALHGRVDAVAMWRALQPALGESLLAAGHAPILLHRLLCLDHASAAAASVMLAATLPEFARQPPETFRWQLPPARHAGGALRDWLRTITRPPEHAPGFGILRLVRAVENAGILAACPVGRASIDAGRLDAVCLDACRVAAESMLTESDAQARYGWSHALTLPQANWALARLGLLDPVAACRNAVAYAAGFRYSAGEAVLDGSVPPAPDTPLEEALGNDDRAAAAAAWHAADAATAWQALINAAVVRTDAHLVKHTLSALELAAVDPAHAHLYRAAAARLVSIWVNTHPDDVIEDTLHER